MEHYVVYDKTLHNHVRQSGSRIPVHPAYNGSARVMLSSNNDSFSNRSQPVRIATLDPNDDMNVRAVLHWLSLSDFYTFPHVVLFSSAEHLVDILNSLTHDGDIGIDASGNSRRWNGLWKISEAMKQLNRTQLKQLLRYWRMRLLDIAQRSPNAPFS